MDVITHALLGVFTETRSIDGQEYFSSTIETGYSRGFTKPKTIINPLVNGWRKPSSYSPHYEIRDSKGNTSTGGNHLVQFSADRTATYFNNGVDASKGVITDHASGTIVKNLTVDIAHANVNEVRMKILNNVKDEVLDAAMVIAEMQSTVDTATDLLHTIGRSLAAFRSRNPRHFYYLLTGKMRHGRRPTDKFLRETAGKYLQWKYGIMPSVYDLQGALTGLDLNSSNSLFNQPPLLVARTSRIVEQPVSILVKNVFSGSSLTVTGKTRSEYKARLDYRIKAEGLRGLNRYGIGLGSIATVLWDKHPFTFVLDMVIPIADIIKAWSALAGTEVVGYSETLYKEVTTDLYSGSTMIGAHPGNVKIKPSKTTSFSRTAYPTPPMPVPYVRNPIKTGNLATVLALFTQLRKG